MGLEGLLQPLKDALRSIRVMKVAMLPSGPLQGISGRLPRWKQMRTKLLTPTVT